MSETSEAPIPNKACVCGSERFRLEAAVLPNLLVVTGTVVVNDDWSITGWSGVFRCAECDAELPNPELDAIGRDA